MNRLTPRLPSSFRIFLVLAAGAAVALSACALDWESDIQSQPGDGGAEDDVLAAGEGGSDGAGDASRPATWFAFDDAKNWEERTLAGGFAGAAFDGRYVYFAPRGHLMLSRYDTTRGFDDAAAWEQVELPGSGASAADGGASESGFVGAACDRAGNVYLAPAFPSPLALRYSPADAFATKAWQTFDLTTGEGGALQLGRRDHLGVTLHGDHVYFVAHGRNRTFARYDPAADFTSLAAWERGTFPGDAGGGFAGSVATSAGLYLVPSQFTLSLLSGKDLSPASYTTGGAISGDFLGGTTDGTRLYLVPAGAPTAVRFDVGASMTAKPVWPTFDLASLSGCTDACFAGAVFDGRHVYYVPTGAARFVRHDTQDTHGFSDALAWASHQMGDVTSKEGSFFGGAFDGRYVYFVAAGGGKVVRFHAREPAAMPSSYSGSFL